MDIVRVLLAYGADPSAVDKVPVAHQRIILFHFFLEPVFVAKRSRSLAGLLPVVLPAAPLNTITLCLLQFGDTPLHYCVMEATVIAVPEVNRASVAKLLTDAGADPYALQTVRRQQLGCIASPFCTMIHVVAT